LFEWEKQKEKHMDKDRTDREGLGVKNNRKQEGRIGENDSWEIQLLKLY
jgi:hypothetical protein